MMVAALLLCAVLPSHARATEGLEWKLEDGSVRYHLQAQVRLSEMLWFRSERNDNARVAEFRVDVLTSCKPSQAQKKGWELRCDIVAVGLQAAPLPQDAGKMGPIAEEMAQSLTGTWVQVDFRRDGTLKNLHLEGIESENRRVSQIHEILRLVLVRAFAGLDLKLPKKGSDGGKGSWKQKTSLSMGFMSDQGTLGSSATTHEITATEGSVVEITSQGQGTLGSGEMILINGQERPRNLYDVVFQGVARFDTARGLLVYREYIVDARPTASALLAEGTEGVHYVQAVRVQLVEEGQDAPAVTESGEYDFLAR